MRCPKCGYISFDYNIICPKCNKDIGDQQVIVNLPSFRPDPPSLLGVLTGEVNESNIGFQVDSSGITDIPGDDMDISLEDSSTIDSDSIDLGEDQDVDISLEDSEEIEISGDIGSGEEETIAEFSLEDEGEEISLDLDEAASLEPEQDAVSLEDISNDEESAISLDEISLDEVEPSEQGMDEADISLDEDIGEIKEEGLDLGDISIRRRARRT
jgi:hypothetical protein